MHVIRGGGYTHVIRGGGYMLSFRLLGRLVQMCSLSKHLLSARVLAFFFNLSFYHLFGGD